MYKLLLATNDPAVVEAFSAVKWEELGFKQPRVVSTAEDVFSAGLAASAVFAPALVLVLIAIVVAPAAWLMWRFGASRRRAKQTSE